MGVYIGSFEFEGINLSTHDLLDKPGVGAILYYFQNKYELNEYDFIDISEHESVLEWASSLDFEYMQNKFPGRVSFAAYYTDVPELTRRLIVESIKNEFDKEIKVDHQYEHDG